VVAALEATIHRVLDHLAAELADLKLSQGEINALAQLEPGGPVTVAQLQAATGQRASTLTGVLDRLERRGLVERALNPRDRRSFVVTQRSASGGRSPTSSATPPRTSLGVPLRASSRCWAASTSSPPAPSRRLRRVSA
jgi:DNA-binding transcriptional ArsR family regulator